MAVEVAPAINGIRDRVAAAGAPRVLFLLSDPGIPLRSSVKAGGVHARSMVRAFAAEGAEVDVIAIRLGKGEPVEGDRVRVHEVTPGALRRVFTRRFPGDERPNWAAGVEALLMQREVLRTARRVIAGGARPSLIYARHVWLPSALDRVAMAAAGPLYLEVNALFAQEKADRGELAFARITHRLERRVLRSAERVLPVSAALAEAVRGYGVPEDRIQLMPNGVDPDLFDTKLRSIRGSRSTESFTIGLVSSFRPYHGLQTLVEAVALLRADVGELRLLLIGDGPEREAIDRRARELGMRSLVELPGGVPHSRVPSLLAACDVCVAPYEGDHNRYNCPMKLYEYMALKIPIVASAWGEIPRILEDGRTALLHEPSSPASLAARLLEVHADPDAAARRAQAASDVGRTHTWRAHARWILDHAASLEGSAR